MNNNDVQSRDVETRYFKTDESVGRTVTPKGVTVENVLPGGPVVEISEEEYLENLDTPE